MRTSVSPSHGKWSSFGGISLDVGEPGNEPHRDRAHERLRACIGDWRVSGQLAAGDDMKCMESYSWVPGEYFVEYRFDRDVGANKHDGVGVIGYDDTRDAYFAFFVDNMGYARTYEVTIRDSTWTFVGRWERGTITFEPERNRMKAHWEHSSDGREWKLLCEYEGARG